MERSVGAEQHRKSCEMKIVGIISDTHGVLRPEAADALKGSDYIVHAGDIGKQSIIDALSDIAPVTAVRGNVDKGDLASRYPDDEILRVGKVSIYTLHILTDLKLDPSTAGYQVVVHGHSHKPKLERKEDVLYLNPGSAGPRRFSLPVSVAKLTVQGVDVSADLIELDV